MQQHRLIFPFYFLVFRPVAPHCCFWWRCYGDGTLKAYRARDVVFYEAERLSKHCFWTFGAPFTSVALSTGVIHNWTEQTRSTGLGESYVSSHLHLFLDEYWEYSSQSFESLGPVKHGRRRSKFTRWWQQGKFCIGYMIIVILCYCPARFRNDLHGDDTVEHYSCLKIWSCHVWLVVQIFLVEFDKATIWV